MLLYLKLLLVPSLIGAVTLATRRWGPRVGGFLTALPVVAGPVLCFYAIEQGASFAAQAAVGTLLGLIGVVAYCVLYAWLCRQTSWPISLLTSWAGFGVVAAVLYRVPLHALLALVTVTAACLIGERVLPRPEHFAEGVPHSSWDLPFRMAAAATLVVLLTSLAAWLGPGLSGLLAPFPLASAIISSFTHAQRGPHAVAAYFRGFLRALTTFGVFCFVLAVTLGRMPIAAAIVAAIGAQLALQALVLWSMHRSARAA